MMPATILLEAERELGQAVEFYESRCPGLGLDFQEAIEHAVESIAQKPDRWPLREDGTRRCLVPRFPFVIVYLNHDRKVWIIAFAHYKRRPQYWSKRMP